MNFDLSDIQLYPPPPATDSTTEGSSITLASYLTKDANEYERFEVNGREFESLHKKGAWDKPKFACYLCPKNYANYRTLSKIPLCMDCINQHFPAS